METKRVPESVENSAQFGEDDPRWLLVQRIVASQTFSRTAHLRNFLLFVAREALSGDADRLTEYRIGRGALARPENYSPAEDNIVRVQARLLRQRLEAYFATEGAHETLRVEIPKGAYAPHFFEPAEAEEILVAAPPVPLTTVPEPRTRAGIPTAAVAVVPILVAVLAACWLMFWRVDAVTLFWRQIFPAGGAVLLIPTDTSLVALQDLTHLNVPLNGYVGSDYWRNLPASDQSFRKAFDEIAARQQTSMASIETVLSLMKRPEASHASITVRAPHELRIQDVDRVNAILIGARHSNPWVELYAGLCNFNTDFEGTRPVYVTNRSPRPGERPLYTFDPSDPKGKVYGLIAWVPNRTTGKSVLLIRGTGIAGTRSALGFLEQSEMLDAFLRKIRRSGIIPHFDVLLESNAVAGAAPPASVVAWRVLD